MFGLKQYMGWTVDFTAPRGEPALVGPDSLTWQICKNPVAVAIGGICAVLLEFADPRIRTGVWEHSRFATDPIGRATRTYMASMIGFFGPESAARKVIAGINRMHTRVTGETPAGRAYHALDTELLDWVAATASWGFLMAHDRYVRPISVADRQRYFAEGGAVTELYGVRHRVRSLEDFDTMLERRFADFEPHPINTDFIDIMRSGAAAPGIPKRLHKALTHAAIALLPDTVRQRLELGANYDLSRRGERLVKSVAWLADVVPLPLSPPAQACVRLGLPRTFLWRSERARARILAAHGLARTDRERSSRIETADRFS